MTRMMMSGPLQELKKCAKCPPARSLRCTPAWLMSQITDENVLCAHGKQKNDDQLFLTANNQNDHGDATFKIWISIRLVNDLTHASSS